MNVVEKVNHILKQANISKVNLAKYLGVSRQMIYNYFDGEDLSKLPSDKCKLLYDLLDAYSDKEILDIEINNDYIFTLRTNKEYIYKLTNILFENSTVINIEKTDLTGLEQVNRFYCD